MRLSYSNLTILYTIFASYFFIFDYAQAPTQADHLRQIAEDKIVSEKAVNKSTVNKLWFLYRETDSYPQG